MSDVWKREGERIPLNVPFTDRVRPWNELLVWRFGLVEVLRLRTNAAEIVGHGETLPYSIWNRVSDEVIARAEKGLVRE